MTDLEIVMERLLALPNEHIKSSLVLLKDVLDRNQNPGCGGDGSMSEQQWNILRDIKNNLEELPFLIRLAVADTNPPLCEHKYWTDFAGRTV